MTVARVINPQVTVNMQEKLGSGLSVVKLAILSDSSGDAVGIVGCVGRLVRITFNPDLANAPTDNYDLVIIDEHLLVIFTELSLSNSAPQDFNVTDDTEIEADSYIFGNTTFTFANMGDSKGTEVIAYFAP